MNHQCTDPHTGNLLHAYELGALETADLHRFEAHLLECDACFEQIEAFEEKAHLLHSGRQIRQAIKNRIDSASLPFSRRLWKSLWPETPLPLKPAVLLLILIILSYPAYLGMVSSTDHSVRPVQSISLMPNRSGATGALSASAGRDGLISFVVPDAVPGRPYRLEIASPDNDFLISEASFSGFDTYGIGRILIPARELKPGEYRLTVSDPVNDTIITSGTFNFVIED